MSAALTPGQLESVRSAPDGYLLRWSFRVYDDSGDTALYNDSTLVAVPTGSLWKGAAVLVSPVHERHCGVSRILFSETGTRRVDIPGHRLSGQVVVEERCGAVPREELAKCPRGSAAVFLDGTDRRAADGWTAEVLRGALATLPEDPAAWQRPSFPRAWLVVNDGNRLSGKRRRGHLSESVPEASDFATVSGRECLDFAEWTGSKGVLALQHSDAPPWAWAGSADGRLSLESPRGELALSLGGG